MWPRSILPVLVKFASFYYEVAQSPGDEALGSLLQVTSTDHVLFGSDWPYCRPDLFQRIIDTFEGAQSISEMGRRLIYYDNAVSLLK
jgi:6-methylsalicylate decarboxylase